MLHCWMVHSALPSGSCRCLVHAVLISFLVWTIFWVVWLPMLKSWTIRASLWTFHHCKWMGVVGIFHYLWWENCVWSVRKNRAWPVWTAWRTMLSLVEIAWNLVGKNWRDRVPMLVALERVREMENLCYRYIDQVRGRDEGHQAVCTQVSVSFDSWNLIDR